MTRGPAGGRNACARTFRAALPWLALAAFDPSFAAAQTLTADLFNPKRGAFVPAQEMPFRKFSDNAVDDPSGGPAPDPDPPLRRGTPASPQTGLLPGAGVPAAPGTAQPHQVAREVAHVRAVGLPIDVVDVAFQRRPPGISRCQDFQAQARRRATVWPYAGNITTCQLHCITLPIERWAA